MTHWRMRGDDLKRAGRYEFLYKPFEYTQIRILLEKLLATEVRT